MAVREIRKIGDPVLEKKCKEVPFMDDRTKTLINDMIDTLNSYAYMKAVGIAAPQVGVLKKVVVIKLQDSDPMVLINPEIMESSGEQIGSEGCLSLPGYSGMVTRPKRIKLRFMDTDMNEQEIDADGFFARVICHEVDHLDGILYTKANEMHSKTKELENKLKGTGKWHT